MTDVKYETADLDRSGNMRHDFGLILATGKHTDFRIKSGKFVFNVHKAILCSASAFFKAAIEGNTTENDENTISMPEDQPAVIARLLIFIYTGDYFNEPLSKWKRDRSSPFTGIKDPFATASTRWNEASKLAVAMYQIADKTFINALKWTARDKFLTALRPDRDEATEGRTFWAPDEIEDVSQIVGLVYDTTRADDWLLHDPIVHRMLIGMQDHGCVKWRFHHDLMEDVPRLAFEIATSQLGGRRGAPKCYRCNKKTPQRLWRCECGQMEDCEEKECRKLRLVRAICDTCAKFGTCVMS